MQHKVKMTEERKGMFGVTKDVDIKDEPYRKIIMIVHKDVGGGGGGERR